MGLPTKGRIVGTIISEGRGERIIQKKMCYSEQPVERVERRKLTAGEDKFSLKYFLYPVFPYRIN